MEKEMNYSCGRCGNEWSSNDYQQIEGTEEMEYEKHEYRFAVGLDCPICGSNDISGE